MTCNQLASICKHTICLRRNCFWGHQRPWLFNGMGCARCVIVASCLCGFVYVQLQFTICDKVGEMKTN